ncbi:MAG: transposase [Oscillatoriales cyanobacterium]|nr:MAG: transposase [Oscillatoriales cyanobacterium]
MSDYRRSRISGGTFFLTIVTYRRRPLFRDRTPVEKLRRAIATVKAETPFEITAAVVLPDHLHFIWTLPPGDSNFSRRVGRLKVLFTQSLFGIGASARADSESRRKHRESDVWQRRFWEHTIRDEVELEDCLNYIHYNPVKHGLVSCPHDWGYSSFRQWVEKGHYPTDWACNCQGQLSTKLEFNNLASYTKE